MKDGTIVLCPNPYRDRGLALTAQARKLLEADGRRVVVSPVFVELPGDGTMVPLEQAARDAALVVSFGGDGTFLHVARAVMGSGVPLIGVNLGKKGFMTGLEPDELPLLRRAAAGDFRESRRMLLKVALLREGEAEAVYTDYALNDAVVKSPLNCIGLEVTADDVPISNFSGDGVVIATPTGSTAYSMSAGGPIVEPEAENIVVTPICAHLMQAKSFVLSPARTVSVTPEKLRGRPTVLSVDGSDAVPLESGDIVRVRRSEKNILVADLGTRSFYDAALTKLTTTPAARPQVLRGDGK